MLRLSVPVADVMARRHQARQIEARFPGATVWWGPRSGLWLALVRDGPDSLRLIEARDVPELAERLRHGQRKGPH